MINLNKIEIKNKKVLSTRQMAPVYTMGTKKERDLRKFGPNSILAFECSKEVDFSEHNSALLDNLYFYDIDTIEEDIDDDNKYVYLLSKSMCFYGGEYFNKKLKEE